MDFKKLLSEVRVVPVCVFDEVDGALKTAELLLKHNVNIIEVTLRTPAAYDCISSICAEFPELITGAGSVFTAEAIDRAVDGGAVFAVSPCFDGKLLEHSYKKGIPYVPGVATPSELFAALKMCSVIKVFPAGSLGGVEYINSMVAPFKMFDFGLMPTGGIDNRNFRDYLAADKVISCGMSYPVNEKLIRQGKYDELESRIIEIYKGLS